MIIENDVGRLINYYILKAIPVGTIPIYLFTHIEKDEVFLSASVKLSGFNRVAMMESDVLAKKFLDACLPRLKKRYGADFELEVVQCEARKNLLIVNRIAEDSQIIKKRLATGNFAPNRPV